MGTIPPVNKCMFMLALFNWCLVMNVHCKTLMCNFPHTTQHAALCRQQKCLLIANPPHGDGQTCLSADVHGGHQPITHFTKIVKWAFKMSTTTTV